MMQSPSRPMSAVFEAGDLPIASPSKRKRTHSSAAETPKNQIRLRTDLPSRPVGTATDAACPDSPRTAVSNRFDGLNLDNNQAAPSKNGSQGTGLKSNIPLPNDGDASGRDRSLGRPAAVPPGSMVHFGCNNVLPFEGVPLNEALSQTNIGKGIGPQPGPPPAQAPNGASTTSSSIDTPMTPTIHPIPSPLAGPLISPLTSAPTTPPTALNTSPTGAKLASLTNTSTSLRSPLSSKAPASPRLYSPVSSRSSSPGGGGGGSNRVSKSRVGARQRNRSPPPPTPISDLVWSDAEITGHDPDDPADDGYGINGIGFRPTPAMAERRRAQRRKQVEAWKRREEGERRARRREARSDVKFGWPRGRDDAGGGQAGGASAPAPVGGGGGGGGGSGQDASGDSAEERKVRFADTEPMTIEA